jgi:hypothetical protein
MDLEDRCLDRLQDLRIAGEATGFAKRNPVSEVNIDLWDAFQETGFLRKEDVKPPYRAIA